MRDCGVGFVGAGAVADRHARMLNEFPDVGLAAVTDPDEPRRAEFARTWRARPAADLEELLDAGVDAVYVCVPPFGHGRIEEAIAAAGLPMFVEKPLGLDLEVAERVAAVVADARVLTAVGHHWRYAATVRRAHELLADRPVRLVAGAWLDKVPPVPWWSHRDRSGGQAIEQAVHVLDLARLLAGEVVEVHAVAGAPAAGGDVAGATAAALRFADGAVGTLSATCVLGWKQRAGLEVFADGLAITITEDGIAVRADDREPAWEAVDPDDAKRAADRAFVDAVLGRADDVRVPYAEALRTHRLACALARSAEDGEPVHLLEEPNG
ncbi:MAG: gfo/Idh/MocA family oxidoreductase [Actinophytocola sp.]|uniref:Gfo/Idh/MocA family protein n=1 Tax=Actinophytocola sp. TaxID=1872138 RepID=UPI00132990A5|nr:Gfo/Idh/MocA family oxidoreductase [Actinophytocola sp.]MPZ81868.1 gfo/Idh/MocA family oxidoreductase [Actinophytocola sp.]